MTNREWLNGLSDVELARVIHQGSDKDCKFCKYEKTRCIDCDEGITEWLKQKHIEPMPELEAGDIVKTHYAEYVAIGGAVIVNPTTYVRRFLGELDGHIRFIYR